MAGTILAPNAESLTPTCCLKAGGETKVDPAARLCERALPEGPAQAGVDRPRDTERTSFVENNRETTQPRGVTGAGFMPARAATQEDGPSGGEKRARRVRGRPCVLPRAWLEIAENSKARDP